MKRNKYYDVAPKIGRMDFFSDIHNCGTPTDFMPVNLYCETAKGKCFYVCCDKLKRASEQWSVNWTTDPNEKMRSKMNTVCFRTQTETLNFIKDVVLVQ